MRMLSSHHAPLHSKVKLIIECANPEQCETFFFISFDYAYPQKDDCMTISSNAREKRIL